MRIYVVDDHSLFRDGIISLLEAGGHTVIGQAGDGLTAVESIHGLKPDLVIMDIKMPVMDGIEALRQIKSTSPEVKVIMLTVSEDEANLVDDPDWRRWLFAKASQCQGFPGYGKWSGARRGCPDS